MKKLVVDGGAPLSGSVNIRGSKKSVLALISAALLANEPCVIENVPKLKDVDNYLYQLRQFGVESKYLEPSTLMINPVSILEKEVFLTQNLLHPSYISLLGTLLGRYPSFVIEKPSFSLDHHLKGFSALGAKIEQHDQYLRFHAPQLAGSTIYLDTNDPAIATNLMLAAVRAIGTTVLRNAPKDPEVIDLAMFLSAMGASIRGAGTDTIRIEGTHSLRGCHHTVIPDRLEAGIYMILAAATGGTIEVDQIIPHHVKPISAKLREMGVEITENEETVIVSGTRNHYTSIDIKTLPYPGFPIELAQPFLTLLTQATGTSLITSSLSSNTFPLVDLLNKMGANIKVVGQSIMIQGPTQLVGQEVMVHEPASAVALLIAALISAKQTTLIGYEALEKHHDRLLENVSNLGATFQIK